MTEKRINDNSLTVKAGLSVGLIGKARKAKKGLHSDTIEKILYAYPELNPVWFVTGIEPKQNDGKVYGKENGKVSKNFEDNSHNFIPKVVTVNQDQKELITMVPHKAAAGYLNGYADPEYIENLPTISLPGYRDGTFRAFEVRGHSMPPLHSGSFSVGSFVETLKNIKDRRVHIVVSKNDGISIKRVINRPDEQKLILIADNPNKREYPNFTIDYEDILEIWYWCGGFIRELPDPSDHYNRMNDLESKITFLDNRLNQIEGKVKPID